MRLPSDTSRNRGGHSAVHRGKPTRPVQLSSNGTRDNSDAHDEVQSDSSNSDSALSGSSSSDTTASSPDSSQPARAMLRHMVSLNDVPESQPSCKTFVQPDSPLLVPCAPTRAYSSATSLSRDSPDSNESSPEFQNSDLLEHLEDELPGTPNSTTKGKDRTANNSESVHPQTHPRELLKRADEYCTFENVRIFVGTWNVNGRSDPALTLDSWLLPPNDQPPADIYVFGFQELDLSIGAVALNKTSPAALEDRWATQLETALGGLLRPPPSRLHHRQNPPIPEEARAYALKWAKQTGGGYIRLKRARLAGMLMIVYISTRIFSHANASELAIQLVPTGVFNVMGNKGAVGLRLTLYNTAICFVNCHLAAGEANLERRNQDFQEIKRKMVFERRAASKNPTLVDHLGIQSHDIVFVFGDLNYRISGLDSAKVREHIEHMEYDYILGFDEARRVNRTLFQRAYEAVVRSQDLVYNLSLPQAQLDNQELEFGPVRFYEVCQKTLTLTNTGLGDLQYNFRREGIADFPAWLTISPESMAVEKGASVQINVEIFVKPELVSSMNSGENQLSTIVILRLNGGKDYFVSIAGQFIPTCFGLPLRLLLSLETAPVAWLPVEELQTKVSQYCCILF
ncbi:unnamed protein product [Echinostoma caproni]|uniref:IPPc domain-containing protein n=1 Tax=Echinostoma caproni TaxID=27848 RepID=A0A183ACQ5_9TREM|nr:unnamed protein product [Echinostoma caproni]